MFTGKRIGTVLILALGLLLLTAGPVYAQDEEPVDQDYTIQISQVDTTAFPEVTIWVSVTDHEGNPVRNVPGSAFVLTERGQPVQNVEVFQAGEQGPVTTVLVIDRSGSMNDHGKLAAAKDAARAYINRMRPEDATGLVAFNTQVEVVYPITTDKAALLTAVTDIQAFDDTSMYDALAASVDALQSFDGRKAIILLSDGIDNRSAFGLEEVVGLLGASELSVYTIGLGDPEAGVNSTRGIDEAALSEIAAQTNGVYAFTPEPDQLSQLYEDISRRLQNEYRLTYLSPNTLFDGKNRGIEVMIGETSAGAITTTYNPGGVIPETATRLTWPVFGGLAAGLILLLVLPEGWRVLAARSGKRAGKVRLTGADGKGTAKARKGKQVRLRKENI